MIRPSFLASLTYDSHFVKGTTHWRTFLVLNVLGAVIATSGGIMWHPSMAWSTTSYINIHEKVDRRLSVKFLSI